MLFSHLALRRFSIELNTKVMAKLFHIQTECSSLEGNLLFFCFFDERINVWKIENFLVVVVIRYPGRIFARSFFLLLGNCACVGIFARLFYAKRYLFYVYRAIDEELSFCLLDIINTCNNNRSR